MKNLSRRIAFLHQKNCSSSRDQPIVCALSRGGFQPPSATPLTSRSIPWEESAALFFQRPAATSRGGDRPPSAGLATRVAKHSHIERTATLSRCLAGIAPHRTLVLRCSDIATLSPNGTEGKRPRGMSVRCKPASRSAPFWGRRGSTPLCGRLLSPPSSAASISRRNGSSSRIPGGSRLFPPRIPSFRCKIKYHLSEKE